MQAGGLIPPDKILTVAASRKTYGLKSQDLLYAPTGEAVPSLTRLRQLLDADPSALVIIRHLGEHRLSDLEVVLRPFLLKDTVVASDAMPLTWHTPAPDHEIWPLPAATVTHPRTAGTYARALRLLARETAAGPPRLGLIETLRRSSFLPARLLEDRVPAMGRKGRLRPGADADVVVFDPRAVTDQSSYKHSTRPSTGFKHVLVNGVRIILCTALDAAGFINYPAEWWHWSYGDRYWAFQGSKPAAIYGTVQR
jgi:hypothetical protein